MKFKKPPAVSDSTPPLSIFSASSFRQVAGVVGIDSRIAKRIERAGETTGTF